MATKEPDQPTQIMACMLRIEPTSAIVSLNGRRRAPSGLVANANSGRHLPHGSEVGLGDGCKAGSGTGPGLREIEPGGHALSLRPKGEAEEAWPSVGSHDGREFAHEEPAAVKLKLHNLTKFLGFFRAVSVHDPDVNRSVADALSHCIHEPAHRSGPCARTANGSDLATRKLKHGFETK